MGCLKFRVVKLDTFFFEYLTVFPPIPTPNKKASPSNIMISYVNWANIPITIFKKVSYSYVVISFR